MKKRNIRVLMVAPSGGTHGGIEVFTAAIAREVLDSGGCDVRVVYRIGMKVPLQDTMGKALAKFGVPWRAIRMLDFEYLRDLIWADIVHCHFPLVYATYPARMLGKKLVITIEVRHQANVHGRRFALGLKVAHAQWYISKFVASTWGINHFDQNCRIVPAISDLPTAYVAPSLRKGFFFIARWVPLKGIEQLVEAYATADIDRNKHPLYLYGDGPLRNDIESLVDRWRVREFIDMPGFVLPGKKEEKMSSARWNVAPVAFAEDLGLTPIEARCCAVPSIVSRAGGVPEAAGDQAIFCEPGDVSSLKRALEQAATMSEEEYEYRCKACHASLATYLPQTGFYNQEYQRLLS